MMTLGKKQHNNNKALFDTQKYDKCSFSVLCAAYSPLNHNKKSIHSQTCLKLGLVLTDLQYACAGIILNRDVGAGEGGLSEAFCAAPVWM